jgi:2-aminoadipate transaminase
MSLARRRQLVRASRAHGVRLLEDVPYRGVQYEGKMAPTVHALAAEGGARAILVGSFAKTVAPGLRLGFLVADPDLIDACVRLKQGEDFCTSGLVQLIIEHLIQTGGVEKSIARMRAVQAPKLAAMLEALEAELGGIEGIRWTEPSGGLFVWLTLPERIDTDALLESCMARKVAFIPGRYFYPDECAHADGSAAPHPSPRHQLRLNFTDPPLDAIPRGVSALAEALRAML